MAETWLRCEVMPGQFSTELAVQAQAHDGSWFSLFAPVDDLDCDAPPSEDRPVLAWLKVTVADKSGNLVMIRLPQRALENGSLVTVREDQLESAASRQEA